MDDTRARQFHEYLTTLYIRRDVERMADYYTADVISHPSPPGLPPGITGLQLMMRGFLSCFTDVQFRVESFTQEGDMLSCHLVTHGTHSGDYLGIAATGRRVEIVDHLSYRLENGRIAEFWSRADPQALLSQLGASHQAA